MQRYQLIELEDLAWWPHAFRNGCTEYLETLAAEVQPYHGMIPRLMTALQKCQTTTILDLCSGAGGPWKQLLPALLSQGCEIAVWLTDKFPNVSATARIADEFPDIRVMSESVDATQVPATLKGLRTLFAAFHHFKPQDARAVLAAAVRDHQGIAVFEFSERSLRSVLMAFLIPVMVLLLTPFVRPFRWTRIFWTYFVPVLPVAIFFDGLVSCLRTYTPTDLQTMVAEMDSDAFEWDIGVETSPMTNVPITYLIGIPRLIQPSL